MLHRSLKIQKRKIPAGKKIPLSPFGSAVIFAALQTSAKKLYYIKLHKEGGEDITVFPSALCTGAEGKAFDKRREII